VHYLKIFSCQIPILRLPALDKNNLLRLSFIGALKSAFWMYVVHAVRGIVPMATARCSFSLRLVLLFGLARKTAQSKACAPSPSLLRASLYLDEVVEASRSCPSRSSLPLN
jgi:hypothetical protein